MDKKLQGTDREPENGGSLTNRLNNRLIEKSELPYERFSSLGPGALTDAELLALMLRTGTTERTPMDIAQEILRVASTYEKGVAGLHHLSVKELMDIPGIGEVKAIRLKCVVELSNRMASGRNKSYVNLSTPVRLADRYMEQLCHEEEEHVVLVCLNGKSNLMSEHILSSGTVRYSALSAREVFVTALRDRAVRIALLHNHPSGDPEPSLDDVELTERIARAGHMLDIPLMDHVIIGDHRFFSFKENSDLV